MAAYWKRLFRVDRHHQVDLVISFGYVGLVDTMGVHPMGDENPEKVFLGEKDS
jgi:hypothetical protein